MRFRILVRAYKIFVCTLCVVLVGFVTISGGSRDHRTYFGGCGGSELPIVSTALNGIAKYGLPLIVGLFLGLVVLAICLFGLSNFLDSCNRKKTAKPVDLRISCKSVRTYRWTRFIARVTECCICPQCFLAVVGIAALLAAGFVTVRFSPYYCPSSLESYAHVFMLTLVFLLGILAYPARKCREVIHWEHVQGSIIRALSTLPSDICEVPLWSVLSDVFSYWPAPEPGSISRLARLRESKALRACLPAGFSLEGVDLGPKALKCLIKSYDGTVLHVVFGECSHRDSSTSAGYVGLAVAKDWRNENTVFSLYRVSSHATLVSCLSALLPTYVSDN